MNRLIMIIVACMAASPFVWRHFHKTTTIKQSGQPEKPGPETNNVKNTSIIKLKGFANRLQLYAKENGYNTQYCFLVDMHIASGSNRFFVYDLKHDSVMLQGLVAHGYGNSSASDVNFSNVAGSNSSSAGKYKIGKPYIGRFGLAYKLYGLDKTNSNAYNRFVVLHAHECVPDAEVAPGYICMSQGCPTVAPAFLKKLAAYIDQSNKPVLLWIYK